LHATIHNAVPHPDDPREGRVSADVARMRERQRLARDLHDSVAQVLFAIGVEARTALDVADPAVRERALRSIQALAADARAELHATLTRLTHAPRSLALHALLDNEVDAFAQSAGIRAAFVAAGDLRPLGDLKDELVLDTLLEALRNIRKHAVGGEQRPSAVLVRLDHGDETLHLCVRNDGVVRGAPGGDAPRGGLKLLAERAAQARGTLDLRLPDEGGAIVDLRLPAARR
jgi:signal transduction histidine kinase